MYRLIVIFILIFQLGMAGCDAANRYDPVELLSGYMTIVDDHGQIIMQTGLTVTPGDQFIDEHNRLYEISSVEGTLAKARFLREESDIAYEALVVLRF